jgi:hypothetical protein
MSIRKILLDAQKPTEYSWMCIKVSNTLPVLSQNKITAEVFSCLVNEW